MEDLLALRTKLRTKATKLCFDLRSFREADPNSQDQDRLALKLHHGEMLQIELQNVQSQLNKSGQSDDSNHVQALADEIFLGSRLLARLEKREDAQSRPESLNTSGNTDLKSSLTVKIPIFHGDIMKWPEFWELFAISVHNNPGFVDIQKFVVLKSHLAGAALQSIQGIPVTHAGYCEAVIVLKKPFRTARSAARGPHEGAAEHASHPSWGHEGYAVTD